MLRVNVVINSRVLICINKPWLFMQIRIYFSYCMSFTYFNERVTYFIDTLHIFHTI